MINNLYIQLYHYDYNINLKNLLCILHYHINIKMIIYHLLFIIKSEFNNE